MKVSQRAVQKRAALKAHSAAKKREARGTIKLVGGVFSTGNFEVHTISDAMLRLIDLYVDDEDAERAKEWLEYYIDTNLAFQIVLFWLSEVYGDAPPEWFERLMESNLAFYDYISGAQG